MRAIRTISWVLTFVAIGAAAAAWFTPRPDVDADLAADVAIGALESAGIDDAEVIGTPKRGVFQPRLDSEEESDESSTTSTTVTDASSTTAPTTSTTAAPEPEVGPEIPVWVVVVSVGGDQIEMKVDDADGQLVFVDDLIGEDKSERALTDEQWEDVSVYRDDHHGGWVTRNTVGSVAAAVIVGVGFTIARRSGELG